MRCVPIVAILVISVAYAFMPTTSATHSSACGPTIIPPSSYCVTSDFHGTPVPLGTTVNVMAFTTDTTVTRVRFIWHAPDGTIPFDEEDSTFTIAPSGASRFDSIHEVTITGDWGVQAVFCTGTPGATCNANNKPNDTVMIRATSFEGVPEFEMALPLITAGAFAAFLLGKKIASRKTPE